MREGLCACLAMKNSLCARGAQPFQVVSHPACSHSTLPKQGLLSPGSLRASSPNCSCENNAHSRGLEKIRQRGDRGAREGLCFARPSASTPILNTKNRTSSVCWEEWGAGDFEVTEDPPSVPTDPRLTCTCAACSKDVAA